MEISSEYVQLLKALHSHDKTSGISFTSSIIQVWTVDRGPRVNPIFHYIYFFSFLFNSVDQGHGPRFDILRHKYATGIRKFENMFSFGGKSPPAVSSLCRITKNNAL